VTPAIDEPLLRVRGLSVTYPGESRVRPSDVSFDASPGEVVLVLGPSGSGKSTLTLTLDGLIPHAVDADLDGAVAVAGADTRQSAPSSLSTRVGMVFQDPDAQIVTGTVFDEVAFALENLRLPVAEVLARTEQSLRRMSLWHRRDDDPDALSGGGRQRLAIACALATGASLLVLDEPTANLDPAGVEDVYAALHEAVASGERAVVLVEHDLDAAVMLATRVVVLDGEGRLVHDGPTVEVLRERAEELARMGVWLPAALLAGLRLRDAGWRMAPLPLTPAELAAALAAEAGTTSAVEPTVEPRRPGTATETEPTAPTITRTGGDPRSGGVLSPAPSSNAQPFPGTTGVAEESSAPLPDRRAAAGERREPAIGIRGLTVRRGGREVLHDVGLDLPRGSFTAVIGPNGAGKTTLAQSIAGVVAPPAGAVRIAAPNGVAHGGVLDPATATPRELAARVGFVFQNPEHQFIAHTVFDELAHGLRIRRVPEGEVRERVAAMLERFGLADHADAHPFRLSGGQKRRLSVGTAVITRPGILVLDEPTFGQDRARAEELLALLSDLHDEGTTVVIVTHDLDLAARFATHVAVVSHGRLVRHAPAAEVFADEALLTAVGLRRPALLDVLSTHPVAARALGREITRERSPLRRPSDERSSAMQRENAAETSSAPQNPSAMPVAAEDAPVGSAALSESGRTPREGTRDVSSRWRSLDDRERRRVAGERLPFLHRLNPLVKLAAVVPAMALLLFTRDLATPAAFLVLSYALVLTGARLTRRTALMLCLVLPAMVAAIGAGFSLWADGANVAETPVVLALGGWRLHAGALEAGFATGLRLAALLALALIGGATTEGPDLVRSAIRQLRLPYRIGYAALAAYRFVPRFGHELDVIRAAHRVRGRHGGRGPLSVLGRGLGYAVPLLAGAIRHAERVALAMDARAFGAHPTRTERYEVPWRGRDTGFLLAFWIVTAALFSLTRPFG
jgi:energy-coupling factor transport system ATP-binding protein